MTRSWRSWAERDLWIEEMVAARRYVCFARIVTQNPHTGAGYYRGGPSD